MSRIKRVVLVGHCGPDSYMLRSKVQQALPGLAIEAADAEDELERTAGPDSLLLINRALDYGFTASNGVELIRNLSRRDDRPVMMLISNYADAQSEAQAAGALPGFGKSELGKASTEERLRKAAGVGD
jgi:hypothetical protein